MIGVRVIHFCFLRIPIVWNAVFLYRYQFLEAWKLDKRVKTIISNNYEQNAERVKKKDVYVRTSLFSPAKSTPTTLSRVRSWTIKLTKNSPAELAFHFTFATSQYYCNSN